MLIDVPNKRVRIDQESHSIYSLNSSRGASKSGAIYFTVPLRLPAWRTGDSDDDSSSSCSRCSRRRRRSSGLSDFTSSMILSSLSVDMDLLSPSDYLLKGQLLYYCTVH